MKKPFLSIGLLFVLLCAFVRTGSGAALPEIKYEKYKLPNGLEVILREDHSIPLVAVNVWYHVGSKNEKTGRTGFAHLFEHMMFEGSQHSDVEWTFEDVGGSDNGTTNNDRTMYYETLPPNHLERALWMESDRMGFLLPAMTQKKLANQIDVVKNERRQRLENEPYNKVYDFLPGFLYPKDHPYSWSVIGSMADLSAASLEDVSDFFRSYYTPNNASLCIAGDINPAQVKQWVEKYFGPLPPGPPVDRIKSYVPRIESVRRAVLQDNVHLAKLLYIWTSPAQFSPGDAELDLLAKILSDGKTSRLYKTLVYDKQIAQDVDVSQDSHELGGEFTIDVTVREGHTLDEVEKAVDEELQKVLDQGVTPAELVQAQTGYEATFVRGLQRLNGVATLLNTYNTYLGNPGSFQWDLDRYSKATAADIQRTARATVDLNRRAIVHIVPFGDLTAAKDTLDRTQHPQPAPEPVFNPPSIQRAKLSNGIEVFLAEDHKLPLVQVGLILKSGWAGDPADRPGAASLTSELLDEGTPTRTALQISEEAQTLGADLSTTSSFDASRVTLNVLRRNLDKGLDLMADVALHPVFPAEELERQRQIYLGRIAQESKEPETSAFKIFFHTLYGDKHPYGQPYTGSGTVTSIKAIQRADLQNYYQANYLPNNAALVIAGDITLAQTKEMFEKAFHEWKPGTVKQHTVPDPPALTKTKVYIADKPGSAQTVIIAGNPGIRRSDPDYEALDVATNGFGGQYTSRLNMDLREDKGYTYGAFSFFDAYRGVGSWVAYSPVQIQNTKEALAEMVKDIRDLCGPAPLTSDEVVKSKDNLIKGYPQLFQSYSSIAGQMGDLYVYDLPMDEWKNYLSKVGQVSLDQAMKTAKARIHSDALLIVVVGDRAKIEAGVRELGIGEVEILNPDL